MQIRLNSDEIDDKRERDRNTDARETGGETQRQTKERRKKKKTNSQKQRYGLSKKIRMNEFGWEMRGWSGVGKRLLSPSV